jgi:hypothetical protein
VIIPAAVSLRIYGRGKLRFPQFIAVAWLALACALAPAHAEKRVALVIGNDRYINLPANEQLQKAANDARTIGDALGTSASRSSRARTSIVGR